MDDHDVKQYLEQLRNQVRGTGEMPKSDLSTEQLERVLQFVNSGQVSPKDYEWFRQNSAQSSNRAYRISPSDRENYNKLNPKNREEAIDSVNEYVVAKRPLPSHLSLKIADLHEQGKISKEDYKFLLNIKDEPDTEYTTDLNQGNQTMANTTQTDTQTSPPPPENSEASGESSETQGAAFVKVNLGSILKRLHFLGKRAVERDTGGKVTVTNEAYDDTTNEFNVRPGVYKVIVSSTQQQNWIGRWFRAKTARKALLTYLNMFLGRELAATFKNASIYRPTTNNGSNELKSMFGKWARGKASQQGKETSSQAGSQGAVEDRTNGVVSYWMKYQLVNSNGSVNEAWIKFAMPGKPLVTESFDQPCEQNGWVRLSALGLARRLQESRSVRTTTERFVYNAEHGNDIDAVSDLKKILESKISERLSRCFTEN